MPALKPTKFEAEVVWLGRVSDRGTDLQAQSAESLPLGFGGAENESHAGVTRKSCVRVSALYPKGTEIVNVRQMSILSQEDLDLIADEMGLESIDPAWVGASLVIKGIPDFTHVPPSSRLQGPDGVTITIDMENRPCIFPGRVIEGVHEGFGKKFKPAATNRRGVTAWVERPGTLKIGETLRLFIPDQPVWSELETARGQ